MTLSQAQGNHLLSHCLAPSTGTLEAGASVLVLKKTLGDPKWHSYRKESESPPAASWAPRAMTLEMIHH